MDEILFQPDSGKALSLHLASSNVTPEGSVRKVKGHFATAEVHVQAPHLAFADRPIRAWGMKIPASSLASSDTMPAGVVDLVPPYSLSWVDVYLDPPFILPLLAWMGIWPQIFFFPMIFGMSRVVVVKDFWLVSLLLYGPLARKSRLLLEIFFLLCFLTFWFAVFFSINSETYEAKRNPENMMLFFEHLISSWSAFSSPIKIIFIFILYVISRAFSYS